MYAVCLEVTGSNLK